MIVLFCLLYMFNENCFALAKEFHSVYVSRHLMKLEIDMWIFSFLFEENGCEINLKYF